MNRKLALCFVCLALVLTIMSCRLPWQPETPAPTDLETPPPIDSEATEEAPEIEPPTATATVTETLIPSDTPTATLTNTPSLPVFADPVIFNLAMFTPLQGWAVTQYDDFLLVTMDGGQTWLDTTPSGLSTLNARPFFLDENTAWFTPGNSGMIYHTQDGGVNWMTASLPFEAAGYFFLDADNGYALVPLGAGAGSHYVALYRTLDGGSSWTQIFTHEPGESKSLPESGTKNGITFLDMNHAWIGGTYPMEDYFYLHYSEDGGTSWSREMGIILPAPYAGSWLDVWQPFFLSSTAGFLPVRALAPDGNQYLLVYSSDDSGQTWSFANSVQDGRDLDFVTVDHGWVASGLGLFHTTDGGTNWSLVTGSGLPAGEFFLKVDFVDDQNGWVITTPDDSTWSPLKLLRTTDGGSNWTQLLP